MPKNNNVDNLVTNSKLKYNKFARVKVDDKSLLDCIKFDKVMFEENLNPLKKKTL